jgi:hypothetical protein
VSDTLATQPWYRRIVRWGQTNLNELDPTRYDAEWWRAYWRRTRVQGLVVNAGGIVAYYPSCFPLHYRAEHLGERDLFGEIVDLARMDSNRALPTFYDAHPDWFTVDANGAPNIRQGRYRAYVNGPYYREYLPDVLRVAESATDLHLADGWATVELPTLIDHELIVFE